MEENGVETGLPQGFILEPNYPNPFNSTTMISFTLPRPSLVRLTICDLLGRKICTLLNEKRDRGSYRILWEAQNFASGVYMCRLETETVFMARKVTLLK
jgi:hypothetical protein